MLGQVVSHYKILEKLGGGGMGVVYKAEDTKLKRIVVLKFLPPELTRDPEAKERFVREAQAASGLDHPNICTIYEIAETEEGQLFMTMACYEGETLKTRIDRGPLKIEEAVDVAIQVAQGLQKAHGRGIVHRDIKPANIMITNDGMVKILDFGLAKLVGQTRLTKAGLTAGTAAYMSPEQARGEKVDHRTDIWSLGLVLYEMLTGQLTFKGEYEQSVMYSILNEEPQPITSLRTGIPLELERMVSKALAKSADERYQHVDEMLVDLRSVRKDLESGTAGPAPANMKRKKHTLVFGAISLVIVLLVAFGLYRLFTGRTEAISSIAVLPLENLSGDKEQEYFVDGMTDELIGELSQISSLRVISRTSIMRYKKTDKSLPQIAGELHVGAIVEGAVLRAGDKVRITAQLIEAATDRHVWAKNYEGELKDVLVLQSSVAQAIAREIKAKLTPQEEKRLESARTVDPEVYQLYLKGRYHWNKRTGDELKKAVDSFNQAIEKDPTYALAHAALAETYIALPEYAGLPAKEYLPRAEALAKRALELDENLAEAHAALGYIRQMIAWDWLGAEGEYRKAIELNPNYPTAHHWYCIMLRCVGRLEEAMREIKRAQELDPLSLIINVNVGGVLYSMRQYDDAIEQFKKTTELDENFAASHFGIGWAYFGKGMLREATKECEKGRVLMGSGPYGLGWLGCCYARTGRESEARKVLSELLAFSKEGYVVSNGIAMVYNGLGDKNKALEWLERACEERDMFVPYDKVDPYWDNLRAEPRFKAVLQKMGLEN